MLGGEWVKAIGLWEQFGFLLAEANNSALPHQ